MIVVIHSPLDFFSCDVARLLPKEEFKPAQPTPNFPKGGTTLTESAYICPIDNKPCYMSNCVHSDEYPALCGNKKERSESAYKEFEGKDLHIVTPESSEPQEKMSYWQYQQFAEAAITQLKDRNETLESEIKALREEQERCLKALEQLANYNKNILEEIERIKINQPPFK